MITALGRSWICTHTAYYPSNRNFGNTTIKFKSSTILVSLRAEKNLNTHLDIPRVYEKKTAVNKVVFMPNACSKAAHVIAVIADVVRLYFECRGCNGMAA